MRKSRSIFQISISILLIAFCVLAICFKFLLPEYNSRKISHSNKSTVYEDKLFPYNLSPYEYVSAKAMLNSEYLYLDSIIFEERKINELVAETSDKNYVAAAIGSSRIMQLEPDTLGLDADSFHNFGVSGADIRDLVNYSYLITQMKNKPEYLIIGLDPWILNPDEDALNLRSNDELYNKIINSELNLDEQYSPLSDENTSINSIKGNLSFYYRDIASDTEVPVIEGEPEEQISDIKTPFGSVLYNKWYRNATIEEIEMRAKAEAPYFLRMKHFEYPDNELVSIFEKLIDYVTDNDIKIIFLLSPYHPIVYDYVSEQKNRYPGFFIIEEWYREFAEEKGISIYGSYNPYVAELNSDDFYDGLHPKNTSYSKLIPELDVIKMQRGDNRDASPYHLSCERITDEIAISICEKKYPIDDSQLYRITGEIDLFDKNCYHIACISSSNEAVVKEYAVDKKEGTIYALGQKEWQYDFLYNSNEENRVIP